jgi:hypothetical protein
LKTIFITEHQVTAGARTVFCYGSGSETLPVPVCKKYRGSINNLKTSYKGEILKKKLTRLSL